MAANPPYDTIPALSDSPLHNMQSRSLLAALALALWAAIAAVPFLSRIHYLPLPQWFGEMNVVWLTLAALLPLALRDGLATFGALPRTSLWLLLLALVWAVQPLWVPLAFPGLNAATAWAFAALALLGPVSYTHLRAHET